MAETTRTRTRVPVDLTTSGANRTRIWYPGSVSNLPLYSDSTVNTAYISQYKGETMTDVVTDGFKVLSGQGKIINNPMSQTKIEYFYPSLIGERRCETTKWSSSAQKWYTYLLQISDDEVVNATTWDWAGGHGLFCAPPDVSDDIAALKSRAIASAWANIDSSEILALVSLAESEKTLAGLLDTARRLYKFTKNVKRLQLKDLWVRKNLRTTPLSKRAWHEIRDEFSFSAICDRYMELRYGWRPLYYDALGATNAFKKVFTALRQTFRGRASDSFSDECTDTYTRGLQPWAWTTFTSLQKVRVDVTVRAGVLCDVDLEQMDPWGFSKIPETIFDLTPYSFVADWFFNVSDCIGAWTPDLGFTPLASWVVTDVVTTQTSEIVGIEPGCNADTAIQRYSSSTSISSPGTFYRITQEKTREPDPSRYQLPTMRLRLSAAKLTDLVIMTKNLMYGGRYPLATRSLRV